VVLAFDSRGQRAVRVFPVNDFFQVIGMPRIDEHCFVADGWREFEIYRGFAKRLRHIENPVGSSFEPHKFKFHHLVVFNCAAGTEHRAAGRASPAFFDIGRRVTCLPIPGQPTNRCENTGFAGRLPARGSTGGKNRRRSEENGYGRS
jgi:hypothetical protein